MTDKKEFEIAMMKEDLTLKQIAETLHISLQALYNKLNNVAEFKASELAVLYELLKIKTIGDQQRIFFVKNVE
jgi:DNA-binding CsgD family transcriptional regulator